MSDYVQSTETILVEKVNKFGVRANDKQYNKSGKYKGPDFVEGNTYEMKIATSPNGAKYINSAREVSLSRTISTATDVVVSSTGAAPAKTVQAVERGEAKTSTSYGSALSPSDKDARILVQGILQAVRKSPTLEVREGETVDDAVYRVVRSDVEFVRNFGK